MGHGSPMSVLFGKIKKCRFALVDWSRVTFGRSKTLLQEKQRRLEELCSLNSLKLLDEIKGAKANINNILHHEEIFWRQQSRSIWLPVGDKNTMFFHKRASQLRRRKNHITGVFDNEGVWGTTEESIANTAKSYFQQLFTSANPANADVVLDSVDNLVTPTMNECYTTPKVHTRGGQTCIISNAPI